MGATKKTIRITVQPDGETSVDVQGFEGEGCAAATRSVERELGTVTERKRKLEFFQRNMDTQSVRGS